MELVNKRKIPEKGSSIMSDSQMFFYAVTNVSVTVFADQEVLLRFSDREVLIPPERF